MLYLDFLYDDSAYWPPTEHSGRGVVWSQAWPPPSLCPDCHWSQLLLPPLSYIREGSGTETVCQTTEATSRKSKGVVANAMIHAI